MKKEVSIVLMCSADRFPDGVAVDTCGEQSLVLCKPDVPRVLHQIIALEFLLD